MNVFGCNTNDMVVISKFINEGKLIPLEGKLNKWVFKTDDYKREFIELLIRAAIEEGMNQINEISFTITIHTK